MPALLLWLMRFLFLGLVVVEGGALTRIITLHGEYNWFGGLMMSVLAVWGTTELTIFLAQRWGGMSVPLFVPLVALVAVYLDSLGDIFGWYGRFVWYDQLVHGAGGLMATALLYSLTASWLHYRQVALGLPRDVLVLRGFWPLAPVALALSSLAGTLYEIEEYLEDLARGVEFVRLGPGTDTADDLLWNVVGSLLALLIIFLWQCWQRPSVSNL